MSSALWLWIALPVYFVVSGLWHGVLIPKRKKMAAALANGGTGAAAADDFDSMARGWLSINGVTLFLLFVILALMLWRPMI